MPDTPQSPPADPVISIGLGTKLGISTAALAALLAAVLAFLNGDHTPETIALIVTSAMSVVTTVAGRMVQAAAAYRAAPTLVEDTYYEDVPTEDELNNTYGDEEPHDDLPEGAVGGKAGEQ